MILRIERLKEIVVADDELIHQVRREHSGRHHRHVVHATGHGLVVRQVRRVGLGHLIPASPEIPGRDVEHRVELVIHLGDPVVAAVRVRIGAHEVLGRRRSRPAVLRPQREEFRGRLIHRDPELIQELVCARHPVGRRRGRRGCVAGGQLLNFQCRKEERLVVDDRAAQREAVLVVANRALGRAGRRDRRGRRQRLVAVEVVRGPVNAVRARFDHEVDGRACVPAHFRRPARLHGKLIDGLDRQQRPGDAGHAALIDRRDVLKRVVVVGAVDLEVVAARAHAVHRRTRHTRGQLQHPREVSTVERQVLHLLGLDHIAERRGHRVEQDGGGGHEDRL